MYATKRRFVDLLSEAYELAGEVTRITYTKEPDRDLEFVNIEYPGGHVDRILVTGNSNLATAREIAMQVSGINVTSLIRGE